MNKYNQKPIKVPRFNEESGFYTTKKRSWQMSKIKAQDSKPESLFRKTLWNLGLRYRKNYKKLPGKPDIVTNKYKLIIFIDGAFWHGYDWNNKKEKIKRNRGFWIPKIERNIQRDRENTLKLENMGYEVMRFWDHEINNELGACINKVLHYIDYIENKHNDPNS